MTSKPSPGGSSAGKTTGNGTGGKKSEKQASKEDKSESFVHVFPDWCKGCGICVEFCPVGVLTMRNQKAEVEFPEKCIRCYLCARRCPDFAIGLADGSGRVIERSKMLERLRKSADSKGEGDSK